MAAVLLGVDGGGTRTRALLVDTDGSVLGHGEAGASNALAIGWRRAEANLQLAVEEARRGRRDPIAAAVFGLAGVSGPEDRGAARRLQRRFSFIKSLAVENDAMIALYAGTRGAAGVLINAGTGAIAVGRGADGRSHRSDGWGYLMGDDGSAYDIGVMALRAAMRAYDGRGPRTDLYEPVMAHFQEASPSALMIRLSSLPPGRMRAAVAGLARVVDRQAKRGDLVARSIVRRAASALTRTTVSVLRRIPEATAVIVTGGALSPGTLLRVWLRSSLRAAVPGVSIRPLRVPPVVGAVLMACSMAGGDEQRCRRSLLAWWKRDARTRRI